MEPSRVVTQMDGIRGGANKSDWPVAATAVQNSDVAIVFLGTTSREGADRDNLK